MGWQLTAGVAAIVLILGLRLYARRQVAAGKGNFLWVVFLPTLLGGVVIVGASLRMLATAPLLAVPLGAAGAIYLAVAVRFLLRASHSVTSAEGTRDIGSALVEPVFDYMGSLAGLILGAALLAVVGLIIWALNQGLR